MLRAKPMNASLSDVRSRQMKKLAEVAIFFLLEHDENDRLSQHNYASASLHSHAMRPILHNA